MRKPKRIFINGSLASAVTGAAIIAASGIASAEPVNPIKPTCHWHQQEYGQYPLRYPQDCKLKEYDSKPINHSGTYTS